MDEEIVSKISSGSSSGALPNILLKLRFEVHASRSFIFYLEMVFHTLHASTHDAMILYQDPLLPLGRDSFRPLVKFSDVLLDAIGKPTWPQKLEQRLPVCVQDRSESQRHIM